MAPPMPRPALALLLLTALLPSLVAAQGDPIIYTDDPCDGNIGNCMPVHVCSTEEGGTYVSPYECASVTICVSESVWRCIEEFRGCDPTTLNCLVSAEICGHRVVTHSFNAMECLASLGPCRLLDPNAVAMDMRACIQEIRQTATSRPVLP